MVKYIKNNWLNTPTLTLYDLQLKTIILLCLTIMARPRSDVGRIQYRDVQLELHHGEPVSVRSEEHTSELQSLRESRMPSSA